MTLPATERRRHRYFRVLFADLNTILDLVLGRPRRQVAEADSPSPGPLLPALDVAEAVPETPAPTTGKLPLCITGVTLIDEQHQHLLRAIQDLQGSLRSESEAAVPVMLAFLHQYADEHFSYEEAYMEHIGFPQRARHQAEHAYFRHQIQQMEQRLAAGDRTVAMELTSLLMGWLQEHIMLEDLSYVAYQRGR